MEISMARNILSYISIVDIATEDLKYASVERIFYLRPGAAMENGLRPITKDDDARELLDAATEGIVQLFMETTPVRSFVGDNDESDYELGYRSSDLKAENSHVAADVGVVHLISDLDRTTDHEFMEAMENLGLTSRRRRVRTTFDEYGLEVEQLNEVSVNNQAQDVTNQEGGPQLNDDNVVIPDVQNTEDVDGDDEHGDDELNGSDSDSDDSDFEVNTGMESPLSSYRVSSQSDHLCADKVDGDEVTSVEMQPFFDPDCDHKSIVFKEGLKFISPAQFKEAVANYNIAVGAVIKWWRSNKKNKEAVCLAEGCKWCVYASWFRNNEAYVMISVGLPHNCGRTRFNWCASAKWVAKQYYNRFRIDPELNTRHLVREISMVHGVDVTVRICMNAKLEARKLLEGSLVDTYAKLRSYVLQLQKSDPEGRFALDVDLAYGEDYVFFKRIYIGFSCLKKGFLRGYRRIFGLDGCFLKGEVKGMILSAIGKDGNN
ncbi:hypothetical protein LINPERPRIM_LOCUS14859 [Linum perenne]